MAKRRDFGSNNSFAVSVEGICIAHQVVGWKENIADQTFVTKNDVVSVTPPNVGRAIQAPRYCGRHNQISAQ